jgi:hypothetical protein
MKKLRYIALSIASVGVAGIGALGVANADSTTSGNVGSSGIPKSVFKEERLDAASEVLNTSTANVQAAHQDKTFSKLITSAGLTKKTYKDKLKTQLTTDLESKGYSQDQITIALQRTHIHHLKHHK